MIDIYADGANLESIIELNENPLVKGFTTNPTLMKQAGILDYEAFAKNVLTCVREKPVSFEVFSDDFDEMTYQAMKIADWGDNVYIKIPITNTASVGLFPVINYLLLKNVKVNVTAIFTLEQIQRLMRWTHDIKTPMIISIFAGRIADTCANPESLITHTQYIKSGYHKTLWASCREVYNIMQAQNAGADIITMPPSMIKKFEELWHKDLSEYSLETVRMFYNDAKESGFKI